MAYRRCLLQRGKLIDRKCHRSFSYILHSDEGKHEEKYSSTRVRNFIQTSSLNGSTGFFSSSQNKQLSPFAGYNFCRNMSTIDRDLDKITAMTDVADVLIDTTMEAVASQAPVVSEVAIAAADSYLPIQAAQYAIDAVHSYTGLNWWADIVLTTLLIRITTIPILLYQLKDTSKLALYTIQVKERREEMKRQMDRKILDREAALKAIVETQRPQIERLREKGVNPYLHFTGSFINCSIFITFFLAITNMAEKMPSFKHGGAFWFTDLSTPDALYIFPVLTALSYLVIVEYDMQKGTEGIPLSDRKKNISRALALLIVPFTVSFPKAVCCFWITSNLFSIPYGMVVKTPSVKKTLGIPEVEKPV
ncbi:unnamed protein product [Lathyrus oleraceus]